MKRLTAPTDSVEEIYEKCISTYQDQDLQQRLSSVTPAIVDASRDFEVKAARAETYKIPTQKTVAGIVSSKEMRNVYDNKFAKSGSPGRSYYDRYLAAPPHGICPICGIRIVSTLDHYLPKSKHPSLVVTPKNLIPTCYDCNLGSKKTFDANNEEEVPLHPYFDDVEYVRWLFVNLTIKGTDLIPSYFVLKPNDWSETFYHRVQHHLVLYNLPLLYSIHAEQEIVGCKQRWQRIYQKCDLVTLRESLEDDCGGRESLSLNSWQSALYRALINQLDTLCTWLDMQN